MKRKITILMAMLIGMIFSWHASAMDYCIPTYNYNCTNDRISNVSLVGESNEINNDSECSENNYGDFTDLTAADLILGETYTLSVSTDYDFAFYEDVRAWIDYNGNGEFDDDEEIAYTEENGLPESGTGEFEFTVPENVAPGSYRLRVRLVTLASDIQPCGYAENGETEDYAVEIIDNQEDEGCEWTIVIDGSGSFGDEVEWELRENGEVILSGGDYEDISFQDEQSVTAAGPVEFYINTLGNLGDNELDYTVSNENGILISEHIDGDQEATHTDMNCEDEGEDDNGEEEGYCEPLLDCGEGDQITNVTFQEINNDTECSEDGYTDYTDQVAQVNAGGTYNISITVGDGWMNEAVSVWIDYDESETFDEDEFTFVGVGSGETLTHSITIPEDVDEGTYRMRVRLAAVGEDDATWDMACDGTQGFGETEDYSVSIVEGELTDCEAPTNIEVTDVTETTAEVTWTPQGDEQSWAVIYGESGFDQENEDDYQTDIVLAPTHTIEELQPETDYDVYVYAICDEDEMIYSDQVGPITFTTDDLSLDSQEFNNFTFYPNPVENQLSLKAGTQIENVQMFNLLGQQVIEAQPNSLETHINTESLQSGVYLMEVSINGNQKTFRVVKK